MSEFINDSSDNESQSSNNSSESNEYIYENGSSNYAYKKNGFDLQISIPNYGALNHEGHQVVISIYHIWDNIKNESTNPLTTFAAIIWDDIQYQNEDYNPFHYDPDPIKLVYRDDLPEETQMNYLQIINDLCNEFYEPTTYYKHFNPSLPLIKLSEFEKDEKYASIAKGFKEILESFNNEDDNEDGFNNEDDSDSEDENNNEVVE
jgi:hypothetical protein